jgi:hypothetical protein
MSKAIDLSKFDSVGENNKGQHLELFFKGEFTGVTLHVLGSLADDVRAYQNRKLLEYATNSAHAKAKGTDAEIEYTKRILMNSEKSSIENALVRVVGWSGASHKGSEEFTKEGLTELLTRNPQWIEDIIEFSENMGKLN